MGYVRHAYQTATPDNPVAEISSDKWNDDHDVDGLVPAGAITSFGGSSAPTGWLLCDGTAVSRSTYADLFTVISTTYGAGNGTTTFNVPNLKGRVAVGLDSGQTEFDALAESGGAKTHTLSTGEMPSHTHTQDAHGHNIGQVRSATTGAANTNIARTNDASSTLGADVSTDSATATNQNTGGGGAHNNLQPYLVVNVIIKT